MSEYEMIQDQSIEMVEQSIEMSERLMSEIDESVRMMRSQLAVLSEMQSRIARASQVLSVSLLDTRRRVGVLHAKEA